MGDLWLGKWAGLRGVRTLPGHAFVYRDGDLLTVPPLCRRLG